jgi:hypothetical protein
MTERTRTLKKRIDIVRRYRVHFSFVAALVAFAAVFITVALSAFHRPTPHGLPVGVVAPAPVTRQLQGALDAHVPGGFDLRAYDNEADARTGITSRQLDGALVAEPSGLRLMLADAGGTGPAQALTGAFEAVATRTGQHLTVVDVVPPLNGDSSAFSSYFMILCVLFPSVAAGHLSAQIFRRDRRGWRIAAPALVAVATGAVVAGIADAVTGFGDYLAMAGIVALFSVAISAPTAALGRIKPPLLALAILVFIVFGIPVSGGPGGLAPFGPGFLRALDSALPLGVAVAALRNTVYFHGHGTAGHLWVIATWAAAGTGALALLPVPKRRNKRMSAPTTTNGHAKAGATPPTIQLQQANLRPRHPRGR